MKTIAYHKYLFLSPQEQDNFTGIVKHGNGTTVYHKNGLWHREDGPAVTYSKGSEFWYFEDKLHRIGGPAIIDKLNNTKQYYIHGQKCTKKAHDLWVDLMKMKELKSKT